MIVGTVLLCPPLEAPSGSAPDEDPYDRDAVAAALATQVPEVAVLVPPPPVGLPWVAGVALSLTAAVRGPLLPVLATDAGAYAPALGLSQRAARRPLAGYVLLDTAPPAAGADGPEWPDAPVVYLASPAAPSGARDHARLRAWPCVELADRSPDAVTAALSPWCRDTS